MIGGRRTRKKVVGEKYSTFFNSEDGSSLMARPIVPPRKTTAENVNNDLLFFYVGLYLQATTAGSFVIFLGPTFFTFSFKELPNG